MERIKGTDWWMNWDEALAMGAVDAVVDRPKDVVDALRQKAAE
jgi:enoyl-CoA hydratase/carnithine racemase